MFVSNTSKSLCLLTLSLVPLREAHWACLKCCLQNVFMFLAMLQRDLNISVNDFINARISPLAFEYWRRPAPGFLTAQILVLASYPYPRSRSFDSPRTPVAQASGDWAAAAPHKGTGARAERRRVSSHHTPHHSSSSPEAAPAVLRHQRHNASWGDETAYVMFAPPNFCSSWHILEPPKWLFHGQDLGGGKRVFQTVKKFQSFLSFSVVLFLLLLFLFF